jgi:AcrR family transcriptional regulator
MAQTLKPNVRRRIEAAAVRVFASSGFHGASMAAIAREAGVSTGNVYRYVPGKEALFDAVVDERFVARFRALLDARVASLSGLKDPRALDPEAAAHQSSLLEFWIAHRLQVVILLDRCEGTALEGFAGAFVQGLAGRAIASMEARAGAPLAPTTRFVVERIFDGTRRTLVAILEAHEEPAAIRTAFATFWSFQLAGLAGLQQEVSHA